MAAVVWQLRSPPLDHTILQGIFVDAIDNRFHSGGALYSSVFCWLEHSPLAGIPGDRQSYHQQYNPPL